MKDIDRDILLTWARAELENWKEGTKLWKEMHPNHCSGSEHKGAMWEAVINVFESHDKRVTGLLNANSDLVEERRARDRRISQLESFIVSRGYEPPKESV